MGQTALLDRVGAKFLWEGGDRVELYPKMGTLGRRARELGWLSEHYQARSWSQAAALGLELCPTISGWDLRNMIP